MRYGSFLRLTGTLLFSRSISNYTKNRHHTGTVTSESSVEDTTHRVANFSSFLYLDAMIAVVLAAGIAAKTTDTRIRYLTKIVRFFQFID